MSTRITAIPRFCFHEPRKNLPALKTHKMSPEDWSEVYRLAGERLTNYTGFDREAALIAITLSLTALQKRKIPLEDIMRISLDDQVAAQARILFGAALKIFTINFIGRPDDNDLESKSEFQRVRTACIQEESAAKEAALQRVSELAKTINSH